jgi:ubiquinone/menaquinone biosynthesis C-methylase UbiE
MAVLLDPEQEETKVIHELIDFTSKDVLEVGCGDGRITWRLSEAAHSVLGLDLVAESIKTARASVPAGLQAKVSFQVADITMADLPQAAFDVVVLSWSLC